MAQLFLSYSRKNRECAELLANALSNRGWSVWWDRRIQIGRSFSEVIEHELEQAQCIIVLWSRDAIASEWVQNEAGDAARRKILVPIRIEDVRPPLEFRRLQAADLFEWQNGFEGPDFDRCLASIELLVPKAAPEKPSAVADDSRAPVPPASSPVVTRLDSEKVETARSPADGAHAERPAPLHTPPSSQAANNMPPTQSPSHQTSPTEFWISQDGRQFSAPDAATMRQWIKEGRVKADSYVYDPALRKWMYAREIRALRPANYRWPLIASGAAILLLIIIISMRAHKWTDSANATTDTAAAMAAIATETTSTNAADTAFTDTAVTATSTSGTDSTATSESATTTSGTTSTTTSGTTSTTTSGMTSTSWSPVAITIENRCAKETIAVAVCYLNNANQWFITGWWRVEPQKSVLSDVSAIGPNIYFYAYGDTSTWYGESNDPHTILLPIRPTDKFGAPVAELKGDGVKSVPFLWGAIRASDSTYTESFTCP